MNEANLISEPLSRNAELQVRGEAKHVAVLFYRTGPYHFARLRAAGDRLRVTAVEFSNVDPTYAWDPVVGREGFERVLLFQGEAVESQPASRILEAVDKVLNRLRPVAVAVPGWYERCSLAALRWCSRHHVPAILMSDTTAWDAERKPWRELAKKGVVKLCAAGLVAGTCHAEYLRQLGMQRDRITLGYDVVDNEYFARKVEEIKKQKAETRNEYGLPERYFLASARFVAKKNLPFLIRAYARYRQLAAKAARGTQKTEIWNLVLLGDGPLKAALASQRSTLNLHGHVLLPGFKQYDELPVYYGLASAFVHASTTEQWGLVVNEAMASGLPVLVSNRCGCALDLVQEGVNGYTFDPCDAEQLAELMLRISARNFPLSGFGLTSREIIAEWGPERFAHGLQQAVDVAFKTKIPRAGLVDRLLLRLLLAR